MFFLFDRGFRLSFLKFSLCFRFLFRLFFRFAFSFRSSFFLRLFLNFCFPSSRFFLFF